MEAAALLAVEGGADDEVGDDDEVAKLDQVRGDAEVAIIIVDLLPKQRDPARARCSRLVVRTMPTKSHMKRRISCQLWWTTTSSSESVTRLSSQARIGGGGARSARWSLMWVAAARPKTRHSSTEFEANRLAP